MSDQNTTPASAPAPWRRFLRASFVLPLLVFVTGFVALVYDTDVVNDAVKVQVVCDARTGTERQAAANAVGVELAQVNCAGLAAVQERRVEAAERFNRVFGLLLLVLTVMAVATRSARRVPMVTLAVVFTAMALAGWKWPNAPMSPVLAGLKVPFVALAASVENSTSLIGRYTHALLLGGVPEELYKSLPLLLILWATMRSKEKWRARLGVSETIEGIAINLAAAAGFVFAETYAPVTRSQATQLLQTQMAVTHIVGGIAGQMAFSAIAGFFIALAMRGSKSRLLYIPLGLLIASVLHATWSAFAGLGGGQSDTIIATLIKVSAFFAALLAIDVARQQGSGAQLVAVQPESPKPSPFSRRKNPTPSSAPKTPTPSNPSYKRYTPPASTPAASTSAAAPTANKPAAPPTISMKAADVAAFAPAIAATSTGTTGLNRAPLPARATPATSYVRLSTANGTFIHLNPGNVVRTEQWPGLAPASTDGVVAQLLANPDDVNQLALFNQSAETWVSWCAGDEFSTAIEPLTVVPLRDGLIIRTEAGDLSVSVPAALPAA